MYLNQKINMKKIHFQRIADSRFVDNIVSEIERLKNGTDTILESIGIQNELSGICRFVKFPDDTMQYRVDYIIAKPKGITYNNLFKAINQLQAPKYTIK